MIESIVGEPRLIATAGLSGADDRSGAFPPSRQPLPAPPSELRRQEPGRADAQHHFCPFRPGRGGGVGSGCDLRPAGRTVALASPAAERTLQLGRQGASCVGKCSTDARGSFGGHSSFRGRVGQAWFAGKPGRHRRRFWWRSGNRQGGRAAIGWPATGERRGSRWKRRRRTGNRHAAAYAGSSTGNDSGAGIGAGLLAGAGAGKDADRARLASRALQLRSFRWRQGNRGHRARDRLAGPVTAAGGGPAGRAGSAGFCRRQRQWARARPRQVAGAGGSSRLGPWPRRCSRCI